MAGFVFRNLEEAGSHRDWKQEKRVKLENESVQSYAFNVLGGCKRFKHILTKERQAIKKGNVGAKDGKKK